MENKLKESILLTKTDYVTGVHCPKSLWLKFFKKYLKEELTKSTKLSIEDGHYVGDLALKHPYFKDGTKVETLDIKKSIDETKKLLKTETVIYEPAFQYKYKQLNCFIRVDILQKNNDGTYNLIEVKSASNTTDRHLNDIAFQKMVLEKNGFSLKNIFIMKPNKKYIKKDKLILQDFFMIEEVSETIKEYSLNINTNLRKFNKLLTNKKEYRGYVGTKCKKPFQCPFYNYCTKKVIDDSVANLSRLSKKKRIELKKLGVKYIKDIPQDFKLTQKQKIQRMVAINHQDFIDKKKLSNFIKTIKYPINHLDFETYSKPIPPFQNTKPNQMIVFQVSLHIEYSEHKMKHYEYLHPNNLDPRLDIINFLIKNLNNKGSIIVWHKSFEISRIKELAHEFPKYQKQLLKLIPRIVDLEDVFTQNMIYKNDFLGRTSIKKILPAMTDEYGYDRLVIQNGSDAQATYLTMINNMDVYDKNQIKEITKNLLSYCELDTLAMKIILDKIKTYL